MTAIRLRQATRTRVKKARPKQRSCRNIPKRDEDAPVETSTGYTFDGAVLYTDLPDTPTGSYIAARLAGCHR